MPTFHDFTHHYNRNAPQPLKEAGLSDLLAAAIACIAELRPSMPAAQAWALANDWAMTAIADD